METGILGLVGVSLLSFVFWHLSSERWRGGRNDAVNDTRFMDADRAATFLTYAIMANAALSQRNRQHLDGGLSLDAWVMPPFERRVRLVRARTEGRPGLRTAVPQLQRPHSLPSLLADFARRTPRLATPLPDRLRRGADDRAFS